MRSVHVARCRSWLRSVVNSPHEPIAAKRVVINTIEAVLWARRAAFQVNRRRKTKMNFKIPFIVLPWIFLPPISRSAPRARSCNYFSAHAAKRNACWMPFTQFNFQRQRRPEGSKPGGWFAEFAVFQWLIARRSEPVHAKFSRPVRVDQFGRADMGIANQIRKARDGQLQFFRIGRTGKKQATLSDTLARWISREINFYNGCLRRIGLQLQAKQSQKHFGIAHGHRQVQNFFVNTERRLTRGLAIQLRIIFWRAF